MEFKWTKGLEFFQDAHEIREKVFVKEQGFEHEFDQTDHEALHVVLYLDGVPVATARLFSEQGRVFHVGRVAVLKDYRGSHLGAALMKEVVRKAEQLGAEKIVLGAQKQAEPFYRKLGFLSENDCYFDEGCPHVNMFLKLNCQKG
ncbi:MAG TPA: GNAT family N-acetyltransferase [Clostridia bacterium]|nr:GNAT family N-acetyltransferase [Clostridia bacterium]